jgi:DMSO reductase anchor subunit
MNPAFSVVIFTTIAGAAQGLVVALAIASLVGDSLAPNFIADSLIVAEAMLLIGLGASFAHLGRPERAWRAVLMWRTSWLSREVIVLPSFIAVNALWWVSLRTGWRAPVPQVLAVGAIVLAALLWYCTAMIYACLRFIEEWAQPLTLVNFTLIGLSSGLVLTSALAALSGQGELLRATGPLALIATLTAWLTRLLAVQRNAAIQHKSNLHSATGIKTPKLVQKSMGMSAGSFNTREFFHGRTIAVVKRVKLVFNLLCFALPSGLALWGVLLAGIANYPAAGVPSGAFAIWSVAVLCQAPGLLAERWFFFAQAKHPQNLYYQAVS